MGLLIGGLIVWAVVHFIPTLAIGFKQSLLDRFGEKGYAAIFSLLIVASLLMIVFGWRSTTPVHLYVLPAFTKPMALVLMVMAFLLFGAAKQPTRIKQVIRHPQLTGLVVWSIAHLMLNGDVRSLVLFGGLGLWGVIEINLISRREGEWVKPSIPTWSKEATSAVISLVVFGVLIFAHPYLAGVPVR